MIITGLHPDFRLDDLGMMLSFLDENDPRPVKEQFNDRYRFGGGWQPIPNCKLKGTTMRYPGDPPFKAIAQIAFRDEVILIFEHCIFAIVQRDGSYEVARMD